MSEKQQIERLYTSGSADFIDGEGDIRPIADLTESMEKQTELFPSDFSDSVAQSGIKRMLWPRVAGAKDSDFDPYWNVKIQPLSSVQKEINRRGIAAVREELGKTK